MAFKYGNGKRNIEENCHFTYEISATLMESRDFV